MADCIVTSQILNYVTRLVQELPDRIIAQLKTDSTVRIPSLLELVNKLCQKISFAIKHARDQLASHNTHLGYSPVESGFVDVEIVISTEYKLPRLSEQLVDVPFEMGHGTGQLVFVLGNVRPNALKDAL